MLLKFLGSILIFTISYAVQAMEVPTYERKGATSMKPLSMQPGVLMLLIETKDKEEPKILSDKLAPHVPDADAYFVMVLVPEGDEKTTSVNGRITIQSRSGGLSVIARYALIERIMQVEFLQYPKDEEVRGRWPVELSQDQPHRDFSFIVLRSMRVGFMNILGRYWPGQIKWTGPQLPSDAIFSHNGCGYEKKSSMVSHLVTHPSFLQELEPEKMDDFISDKTFRDLPLGAFLCPITLAPNQFPCKITFTHQHMPSREQREPELEKLSEPLTVTLERTTSTQHTSVDVGSVLMKLAALEMIIGGKLVFPLAAEVLYSRGATKISLSPTILTVGYNKEEEEFQIRELGNLRTGNFLVTLTCGQESGDKAEGTRTQGAITLFQCNHEASIRALYTHDPKLHYDNKPVLEILAIQSASKNEALEGIFGKILPDVVSRVTGVPACLVIKDVSAFKTLDSQLRATYDFMEKGPFKQPYYRPKAEKMPVSDAAVAPAAIVDVPLVGASRP